MFVENDIRNNFCGQVAHHFMSSSELKKQNKTVCIVFSNHPPHFIFIWFSFKLYKCKMLLSPALAHLSVCRITQKLVYRILWKLAGTELGVKKKLIWFWDGPEFQVFFKGFFKTETSSFKNRLVFFCDDC